MTFLACVLGLLCVAVGAPLAGFDTTDGVDSREWERRRAWFSTHDR